MCLASFATEYTCLPHSDALVAPDQPEILAVGGQTKGIQRNADGSYDIYFAPKAPEGKEYNWLQTVPHKSWFTIQRTYGPREPWINKTWRPSEIWLPHFLRTTDAIEQRPRRIVQ
jgi:hypothetical protein